MKCSLFKTIEKRKRTMMTPRVAAIHDMSGFGRCSLTVAIPILSAMGVQCCPLPTAFLSTHTGGFEGFTFLDMTDEMSKVADHWASLGLTFQAVYSGFLGSERQIGVVENFICRFRGPDTVVVVDPVMGDYGRVYQTYTAAMCNGMARLAELADVITPNLTEACMLLKIPPFTEGLSRSQAKSLLVRLSELGPNYVVITGAPMASGQIANIGYDRQHNSFWCILCDYVPVSYPGTGDLFASVLTGGFLTGDSLPMAMGRASYFVERCIKTTFSYSSDTRYGVMLEKELGALIDRQNVKDFSLL